MTTEVKIDSTFFDNTNNNLPKTTKYDLIFSNKNLIPYYGTNVEIIDTSRKTIIVVDPLVLTDKNNRIELKGAIINQKTGRITLPDTGCSLNMYLNLKYMGSNRSKYISSYSIKRVGSIGKLDY